VLVYPGRQVAPFAASSLGIDGVVASIRLKALRRGIQDAGILQLARAVNGAEADRIARRLLPRVLSDARAGEGASWSASGAPFAAARAALIEIVRKKAPPRP
jgi:hypothetical protein